MLLIPVIAALVLVAVLTGLNALRTEPVPVTFEPSPDGVRVPDWPEPVAPDLPRLRPVTDAIAAEASARRPGVSRLIPGTLLVVSPIGVPTEGDLEVAILDADSGVQRSVRRFEGEPELVFDAVPAGAVTVVLRKAGASARYEALTRVPAELPDRDTLGAAPVAVELPVATESVAILLECARAVSDDDHLSSAVTVSVRRTDDPHWRGPAMTVTCPRMTGGQSIPFSLGPLGEGSYQLEFTGFTPEPDVVLTFEVPGADSVTVCGVPEQ